MEEEGDIEEGGFVEFWLENFVCVIHSVCIYGYDMTYYGSFIAY